MSGRGGPVVPLSLKEGEEEELRSIAGSRTLTHGKVQRVQIVPGCTGVKPCPSGTLVWHYDPEGDPTGGFP